MDDKEAEKKRSLRNEKLKANRNSETEEQRKERLRIRSEKDRARRRTVVTRHKSSQAETLPLTMWRPATRTLQAEAPPL